MANNPNLIPNNANDPIPTQLGNIQSAVMQLNTYLENQGSNIPIDYTMPLASKNFVVNTIRAIQIPGFVFNTSINNTNCDIRFSLSLQGNGQVQLWVNNALNKQYYFNNTGFTVMSINSYLQLPIGNCKIQLLLLSIANGSNVTLANSKIDPGNNTFQLATYS